MRYMADHGWSFFVLAGTTHERSEGGAMHFFFFFAGGIVLTQLLLAVLNGGIDVRTSLLVHNPGDL